MKRGLVLLMFLMGWGIVVCISLELWETIKWWRLPTHNEFILSANGKGPCPSSALQPDESEIACEGMPNGWDAAQLGNEPFPVLTIPDDPKAAASARIALFGSLTEEERRLFDVGLGTNGAIMDSDGIVLSVYRFPATWDELRKIDAQKGKPLSACLEPKRAGALLAGAQEALTAGGPVLREVPPAEGDSATASAVLFPITVGGAKPAVACFIRENYELPADTAWEVPYYRYKKNSVRQNGDFVLNGVGCRDDEVAVPKPPGVFRIVCVGGSTTEEGSTNAMSYPNLVERQLKQYFAGMADIDVVNCGAATQTFSKIRSRLIDRLLLQPDLVICTALGGEWFSDFPYWAGEAPLWQKLLRRSRFARNHFNSIFAPSDDEMLRRFRDETEPELEAMMQFARKHGTDIAFCSHVCPDATRMGPRERDFFEYFILRLQEVSTQCFTLGAYCRAVAIRNRVVKEFCEKEGILYIPVAENVKGGFRYFADIAHMQPEGIVRKADIVAKCLKDYVTMRLAR